MTLTTRSAQSSGVGRHIAVQKPQTLLSGGLVRMQNEVVIVLVLAVLHGAYSKEKSYTFHLGLNNSIGLHASRRRKVSVTLLTGKPGRTLR